ncbi:hypothetical protein [Herbaspirillum sp. YR522]|uniref:hypothetical protein n=1 Tax=Herbaspirillum sp. YR522 TaxID=1144342 RepID=UPI00058B18C9|nr:hypothetical protein [Herbaspirillum sp. YR522]
MTFPQDKVRALNGATVRIVAGACHDQRAKQIVVSGSLALKEMMSLQKEFIKKTIFLNDGIM